VKDFTTGSIPRLMIKFLIPLLLSNMLQAAYMIIDAIWAGRLIGPSGVAIVATGMPVVFLLSSLIAGIIIGASILAGQAFGSKNHSALSDIISTSLIGTVAASVIVSIIGVVFCGMLLKAISTPPELYHGARIFLSLIIGSMTLSSLGMWFSAIMNATGDSKTPFKILLVSLIINSVLAPLLITGAGVIAPLGVAGSAVSTIIANIVAAVISYFALKNHRLFEIVTLKFEVHWKTFKKIVGIGFPMALQMIIVSSSFLFILSLANRFGANVTAAFGIGSRVDQLAFLASFAVTAAISAMTAQHIGARKLERIPQIMNWGLLLSVGMALLFSAAVLIFPDAVTGLFTKDRDVILLTNHYLRYAGVSYLALAVLFAYQGVLRGAGDTLPSFIIIASTMIFLRVPLCFILSHKTALRESGLWAGILISSIAGAVAFYFYYSGGRWKKRGLKLTRTEEEVKPEPLYMPEIP